MTVAPLKTKQGRSFEGAVDLQRREHLVGDKVYDNFGIIYNARVEIDAIFCALGFLRLKLAENLQLLIQADSMPAEEFQDYAKTLTEPIELKGLIYGNMG